MDSCARMRHSVVNLTSHKFVVFIHIALLCNFLGEGSFLSLIPKHTHCFSILSIGGGKY
jgi:hypothetical protein